MASNDPPKRRIQGFRGSVPSGFVLGRTDPGEGDVQLLSLKKLQSAGLAPTTLPPSGKAGGDLGGTYPNPTVVALQGSAVSNVAPTNNQVLRWITASAKWVATTLLGLAPAGGTTGQVLEKNSGTDFDYSWATPASGGGGPDYAHRFLDTSGQEWQATVLTDDTPLVILDPAGVPVYVSVPPLIVNPDGGITLPIYTAAGGALMQTADGQDIFT